MTDEFQDSPQLPNRATQGGPGGTKYGYSWYYRAAVLLWLRANGYPDNHGLLTQVHQETGIGRATLVRWWANREQYIGDASDIGSFVETVTKDMITVQITALMRDVLDNLADPDKLRSASAAQLAVVFGILADKLALLSGAPTQRIAFSAELAQAPPWTPEDDADARPALPDPGDDDTDGD